MLPGIINYKQFDYAAFRASPIQPRKRGNPRSRLKKKRYKATICAFDIETTRLTYYDEETREINDKESIMYIWQFQYGIDGPTIIGRSWKECFKFFRRLAAEMSEDEYLVIYVHNLSFEFSFLRQYYAFSAEEVFATDSRRILKCEMFEHLELRCSYMQTNMSLSEFTSKMGVKDLKLSGDDFNYELQRFPWTPISDEELHYAVNDVRGLVQAITIEMMHDLDDLYTIPLTSTGYVRRDVKAAMRKLPYWYVKDMLPDWPTYVMLREAFRGGNTHANRYYAGQILTNVRSADRSSSYPDTECNDLFPVARFELLKDCSEEKVLDMVYRRGKAILTRVRLRNVRLKNKYWGCPYLARDKCRYILNARYDNGRIMEAEYLETTVTDIDLKIILDEYDKDQIEFFNTRFTRYGLLPAPLVRTIQFYYRKKTELKGVDGQAIYYTKNKNKLNSVYGMSATNPVKPDQVYDPATGQCSIDPDTDLPALLEASNKKAFFPYQWGVWCTARARERLEDGIKLAHDPDGKADFVYCDTDSVKYIGEIDWTAYNEDRITASKESGSYAADAAGNIHYMGVYEYEGQYKRFATRGAKKYAYEDQDGKLHITIAGVNKTKGAEELKAMGGLEAFLQPTVTFSEGETESVYMDSIRKFHYIDGRRIKVGPGVTIRPSMKTMSDTEEYADLLEDCEELLYDDEAHREALFNLYGYLPKTQNKN